MFILLQMKLQFLVVVQSPLVCTLFYFCEIMNHSYDTFTLFRYKWYEFYCKYQIAWFSLCRWTKKKYFNIFLCNNIRVIQRQLIIKEILNSVYKETKPKYTFLAKFIQRQYFFALCKLNKNEVLYKHMEEGHFLFHVVYSNLFSSSQWGMETRWLFSVLSDSNILDM